MPPDDEAFSRLPELIAAALAQRAAAYAPYSQFLVGAALLGEDGRLFTGCNVENASYGLCLCAERGAIATAVAAGTRRFSGLVVATQSSPPSPPCGLCRQTLAEFAEELPIVLVNTQGERHETTLQAIFPMGFTRALL